MLIGRAPCRSPPPAQGGLAPWPEGTEFKAGDRRLHFTNEYQRWRGAEADSAQELLRSEPPPQPQVKAAVKHILRTQLACKGSIPFAQLEYADMQHLFRVPVAHALLYGVVRTFMSNILASPGGTFPHVLSHAQRRGGGERGAGELGGRHFGGRGQR